MANVRKDVQAMVAVHAPISNLCEQRRARNARATGSSGQHRPGYFDLKDPRGGS
jgi:hypothetical protein